MSTASNSNQNKQQKMKRKKKSKKQKVTTTVQVPVAISKTIQNRQPVMKQINRSTVLVSHSELLLGIAAQQFPFHVMNRLRINPGSSKTFPWLSGVAINFETYKFRKLSFEYISRIGTTASGTMVLSPDYDAADRALVTEQEALMNSDSKEAPVWKGFSIHLKPEKMNSAYKQHFVVDDQRFDTTGQDAKTLDVAQVFVCSQGVNGPYPSTIGRILLHYEVELRTPQLRDLQPSGGAGTSKTSGIVAGSANVFLTNAFNVSNQEKEPIVSPIDNSSLPGPNLFKFNKDWKGYVSKEVNGTGLTELGDVLLNGVAVTDVPMAKLYNGAATAAQMQVWINALKGDLLGSSQVNATTLSEIIHNFGASSVD